MLSTMLLCCHTPAGVTEATREEWFAAAALGAGFQDKAKREDGLLFFSTTRTGDGACCHMQYRRALSNR